MPDAQAQITLCREIQRFVTQIRACSGNTAVLAASGAIEALCAAYLEPDQHPGFQHALTPYEGRIFSLLLARRGQAISRNAFLDVCSPGGDKYSAPEVISVHIRRIRAKLMPTEFANKIETVHGIGYRMAL